MLPSRTTSGQPSALRKSRLEGKPSLLPKPRRPGSIDRQSTEARQSSNTGHRSSSADPPRATFGGRLSRETSATKLPTNRRSRSQQGDRFGQSSMTPLRSSQYSRPTITPVRTPSEERGARSWQTSLERALAFVTLKDQRPISSAAWQRAEYARVQAALAARGAAAGLALIRPLTIARFVQVAGALLAALTRDAKLDTDNYVAKLQGISKRLLYPGTVSKSWLKAVNTLHAFPQALALVSYLMDMANHIEMPVSDEWMYMDKGELARLRRDYLYKSWIRFQEPMPQFEDLNEEYLGNLKELLGDNEEKVMAIQQDIKSLEGRLEDETEAAARADEARRVSRYEALQTSLRGTRAARAAARTELESLRAAERDDSEELAQIEIEIERTNAENEQLKLELEQQTMSVEERARLLDEVDYAARVQDSKRTLLDDIGKMVTSKETELALWQKKTLDACVQYTQGLLRVAAEHPALAALAVDETELMDAECAVRAARAVETLRECATALAERRADRARSRTALTRQRAALLEETRAKIKEMQASVESEQQGLQADTEREAADAADCAAQLREISGKLEDLARSQEDFDKVDKELDYWEKEDEAWRIKLAEMNQYIEKLRIETEQEFERERARRVKLVVDGIKSLKEKHLIPKQ